MRTSDSTPTPGATATLAASNCSTSNKSLQNDHALPTLPSSIVNSTSAAVNNLSHTTHEGNASNSLYQAASTSRHTGSFEAGGGVYTSSSGCANDSFSQTVPTRWSVRSTAINPHRATVEVSRSQLNEL
jgi:hypothetical protein